MSTSTPLSTSNQKGFAPLVIIISIVVIIFLGLVVQHLSGFGLSEKSSKNSGGNSLSDSYRPKNCKTGEISKFEAEFTDLSKINAINPIGRVGGGSPGRSYIGIKKGMEAPIYSPTDTTLENIVYARRGGPSTPGEYGLYFRLSCDVTFLFDHIDRVSDKIKEVAPKEPADTSKTDGGSPLNLSIKKGELLGYTDGTPMARTFDFLIIDRSKPTTYINPKRWEWEQAVYSQCPYDFFTNSLKEKYYKKIGEAVEKSGGMEFIPAGECGELSHDKLGTASGGWFKGESTDSKGDYLAIARPAKSINRVDIALRKDGMFDSESVIKDYSPKVFPEDVSVGQEVCFHDSNTNKWAYIKLESESKLIFARGTGNCPDRFPQSQSEVWER